MASDDACFTAIMALLDAHDKKKIEETKKSTYKPEEGFVNLLQDLDSALAKYPGNAQIMTIKTTAQEGQYSDFMSDSPAPIVQLQADLLQCGLHNMARNVSSGRYDHGYVKK